MRRMKEVDIVRRMLDVYILGKRRRERSNLRWTCRLYMTHAVLKENNAKDTAEWRKNSVGRRLPATPL